MKFIGLTLLIVILILTAAYFGGVFEAEVDITMNKEVKKEAIELTHDTLKKAKESTDKAFQTLEQELKDIKKNGKR